MRIPQPTSRIQAADWYRLSSQMLMVDVRSEKEFERDHLPRSASFPILDNQERHEVGWVYKNIGSDDAFAKAEACAHPKLAGLKDFIATLLFQNQKSILGVTCWRGGGRSSFVWNFCRAVFSGIEISQLEGGTKAYRHYVQEELSSEAFYPNFKVISGLTGSGKSKLLERLSRKNVPVLNIEECARHMSSVFGDIPYQERGEKVSQRQFENLLHWNLQECKDLQEEKNYPYVYVEAESRRVGPLVLPEKLAQKIHASEHVELQSSLQFRYENLKKDYFDGGRAEHLPHKLKFIEKRLGSELLNRLQSHLKRGESEQFFKTILIDYYDKVYKKFPRRAEQIFDVSKVGDLDCIAEELSQMEMR